MKRYKKSSPTIIVSARSVPNGAYLIANSGAIREMTPNLRNQLRNLPVRTFA